MDFLSALDPRRGSFTRVVANGTGSEYLFTSFFPDDTDDSAVAAQLAVIESELRTIRDLCEAP